MTKTVREVWLEQRVSYLESLLNLARKYGSDKDNPYPSRYFEMPIRYNFEATASCAADLDNNGLFVTLREEKNFGSLDQLGFRYQISRSTLMQSNAYQIADQLKDMHERLIQDLAGKIHGHPCSLAGS